MESEAATKVNETESLPVANESKENAIDKTGEQQTAEKEETSESSDKVAESVVSEADTVISATATVDAAATENGEEEETTTTTVTVTKKENAEAEPQTETKTTTTVIVTKKENDANDAEEEAKTTTTTTTSTVIVTKSEAAEPTENETVTTVVITKKPKAEDEQEEQKEEEKNENENVKEEKEEITESEKKPNPLAVAVAVVADESEESESEEEVEEEEEESEAEAEAKPEPELQPEPKINAEKIEDVQVQAKIAEQPEVKNTEVETDGKAHKDINDQIENIISDIDINIKAQEKITQLKEQELQLIQKQQELANQIQQQQLLAQRLIAQNRLQEQELQQQQQKQQLQQQQQVQQQQQLSQQQQLPQQQQFLPQQEAAPKLTQEYTNSYSRQEDSYDSKESSNVSRTFDLRKIFTPATDAPQILPKNRKLYASSAFYSPTLHPTVEDQVELARRISHSLSDISNQKSKGQSMYVNRKKRSVKWVHEASGQGEDDIIETQSLNKENAESNLMMTELTKPPEKTPLKLVMNPRGQMRDYNSLKESINIESGLLSPDNCAELITALQLHKGRGAELFAKRRRKAENWVVDETNAGIYSPSGLPDYQQYQARPPTSPNLLPAYSDAGKHRVQLNLHQDQLIEKYSKPGVQVVKSPWEAALQTGSASTAFLDGSNYRSQTPTASLASPVNFNQDVTDYQGLPPASHTSPSPHIEQNLYNKTQFDTPIQQQPFNPQRELAYKPTVAQGWGGRNVELPRGLYVPKEISLSSYAPPPVQSRDQQQRSYNFPGSANVDYSQGYQNSATEFPLSTPTTPYSSVPPKQQLYGPQSYQKVPPTSLQSAPQVNFNPSPLSFDKLAKFQESGPNQRYLNVTKQMPTYGSGVRNASPTPFGSAGIVDHRSTPIKSPQQHFGGYGQNITHSAPLTAAPQVRSAPGQCFNNSARGWSAGSTQPQRNVYCPRVPIVAEGLPYSDF